MRIVIIDNYDSFTFNLYHLVMELGVECDAIRNDKFHLEDIASYDKIIISPGPGIPKEAGLTLDVIKHYAKEKPILGVCLGHQAITEAFGGSLINLSNVYHGVQTKAKLTKEDYIFQGLEKEILVGRYHSWVVNPETLPSSLEEIAMSLEDQVMAIRHKTLDVRGIQFHPESVLTPQGKVIIKNWIEHN